MRGARNVGYSPLGYDSELLSSNSPLDHPPYASAEMQPPDQGGLDVVQFATAIFVVHADEGRIECELMRIGQMEGSLSFSYRTETLSAIPGRQFEHVSGRLEMGPGDTRAVIEVPVFNDPLWNPTFEFKVVLTEPEGCQFGQTLRIARVKVVDPERFPSDKYREHLEMGDAGVERIDPFGLFASFLYLMWFSPGCWWRTVLTVLLDQLNVFYLYIRLNIGIYMVDVVFNGESGSVEDRVRASYRLAFLILAPQLLIYLAEVIQIRMDLRGHLTKHLQKCLFRKFMNYNNDSLQDVPPADMIASLHQDVHELGEAYSKVLQMASLCGKLMVFTFFTVHQNPGVWPIAILVPLVLILWGRKRVNVFMKARSEAEDKETELVRFMHVMVSKLGIIADYNQRPLVSELFAKRAESHRAATVPEHAISHNNVFMTTLMGPTLVALYTAIASGQVVQGQLSQGVFLATISVFGDICFAFSEVFSLSMEVTSRFYYLKRVTCLLNKETELTILKELNHKCRAETKQAMMREISKSASRGSTQFVPAPDRLEIALKNITFAHPGQPPIDGLTQANLSCPQGMICSVLGQPGSGVRTIMDLLGQKIFPSQGMIFMPSHLRILTVSAEPVILNMSLWRNLTFGNPKLSDPDRVERVLRRLKMESILPLCQEELEAYKMEVSTDESFLRFVDKSHHDGMHEHLDKGVNPLEKLNATMVSLIHLARALLANPEVMIMHSPFMYYNKRNKGIAHIVEALLEHRANRGLEMSDSTPALRRPRTIFYNPQSDVEDKIADLSWVMPTSPGGKIEVVWRSHQRGITTPHDSAPWAHHYEERDMTPHPSAPWAHHYEDRVRTSHASTPQAYHYGGRNGERHYAEPPNTSSTDEEVILL